MTLSLLAPAPVVEGVGAGRLLAPSPPAMPGVRGKLFAQCPHNHLKHIVRAQQGVVIQEPQHMKTCGAQIQRALFVISMLIRVLTTIKLNDQLVFDTAEVRVIPSHRVLAPELHTKLCCAQVWP